jgi:glycosyltransferase involved in cell wall biosynthesis
MNIWAFPSIYPYEHPELRWRGIFAHRQYKGLIKNGANLQVVVPTLWTPPFPFSELHKEWKAYARWAYPHTAIHDGITVHYPRIRNIRPNRLEKKTYHERYVDCIVGFFKSNNIKLDPHNDFIYSQWLPDSMMVQEAAHKLGLKSGVLAIGDDVTVYPYDNKKNFEIFSKVWIEADLRCAVADYLCVMANDLVKMNLPYDVIHMGAEHDIMHPVSVQEKNKLKDHYKIPHNKIAILNVGASIARKGWIDLLDALEIVKKTTNDFVLVAVYSKPFELDLKAEASKRGLAENFVGLGEVKPDMLHTVYAATDIFCLPSHWEGIACVLLEAMSSGLPVITTAMCGHPEVINNGDNGILVPTKSPDLLATELTSLITNADKRNRLGETARNFIVNEWGDYAETSKKLYKRIEEVLA